MSNEKKKNKKTVTYLNRVELLGTVCSIRHQEVADNEMTSLTVATNVAYKNDDGTQTVETTWTMCRAFPSKKIHDLSEIGRGDTVHITGRLSTKTSVNANGVEKLFTEIAVDTLEKVETSRTPLDEKI